MSKTTEKLVRVEWVDSLSTNGWGELRQHSDLRCVSAGHLVEKTKDRLVLAVNKSLHNDEHGMHMEIPLCAVKRVRVIK